MNTNEVVGAIALITAAIIWRIIVIARQKNGPNSSAGAQPISFWTARHDKLEEMLTDLNTKLTDIPKDLNKRLDDIWKLLVNIQARMK